jgi:hypothetical protein
MLLVITSTFVQRLIASVRRNETENKYRTIYGVGYVKTVGQNGKGLKETLSVACHLYEIKKKLKLQYILSLHFSEFMSVYA